MKEGLHIVGMGHYAPEHVVTNDDLSKIVDTNDEWISSRTGIRRRHFITEEKNQDMAIAAAKMAIEDAGIDKTEIGVVIVATIRPDHMTPSVACMVQKELELPQDIPCFDINAACSGFMYGVQIARGMLLQSDKKYGVVIGSETYIVVVLDCRLLKFLLTFWTNCHFFLCSSCRLLRCRLSFCLRCFLCHLCFCCLYRIIFHWFFFLPK
jgi:3-oxoacyl-(acyl-carrier-protein) synthase III